MAVKDKVCVTGAGGYIASWLVKLLLSRGYTVHGTVRNPCDEKNAHLNKFENASENLILFKGDLLDQESLFSAISGCTGVFHVASPVPPSHAKVSESELYEPAVNGTRNVLNACLEAKVKRVVVVSSAAALIWNPSWPKDILVNEECWSDIEFCRSIKRYYSLCKTLAEKEAIDYSRRTGLEVVTVCPPYVIGPMLQSTINTSSLILLNLFKDYEEPVEDEDLNLIDVRDVAEALIMVYEKPEAKGRYVCSSHYMKTKTLVNKLKDMYPSRNFPNRFTEGNKLGELSCKKLQSLGWKYRPLVETIIDSVKNYEQTGVLLKP